MVSSSGRNFRAMRSVWWDREASGSAGGAGKAEGGQTACLRGSAMREGEKGGVLGALLKPQRCHMGGCKAGVCPVGS